MPAVQYALRTTPRADTGLSPFFLVYGREPYLPTDLTDDRPIDQHELVEKLLQQINKSNALVAEAFNTRKESINRQNELHIKRRLKISVGSKVMVRATPLPGSAYKLSPKWTGPWTVVQEIGVDGITFKCEFRGRRVRYATVHVSRMRPFHDRPPHLTANIQPSSLTSSNTSKMSVYDIKHRRLTDDGNWEYQIGNDWLSEQQLTDKHHILESELDTFHALYELKHKDHMPRFAKRKAVEATNKGMTAEIAYKQFPIGTKVARKVLKADDNTISTSTDTYEQGQVVGWKHPWWRIQFSNGELIDMNKTELRRAVQLLTICTYRKPTTNKQLLAEPLLEEAVATMPSNFGKAYVGDTINLKFTTGWAKGTLRRFVTSKPHPTFRVLYEGDPDTRPSTLKPDMYSVDLDAKPGSWHLIQFKQRGANPPSDDLSLNTYDNSTDVNTNDNTDAMEIDEQDSHTQHSMNTRQKAKRKKTT